MPTFVLYGVHGTPGAHQAVAMPTFVYHGVHGTPVARQVVTMPAFVLHGVHGTPGARQAVTMPTFVLHGIHSTASAHRDIPPSYNPIKFCNCSFLALPPIYSPYTHPSETIITDKASIERQTGFPVISIITNINP